METVLAVVTARNAMVAVAAAEDVAVADVAVAAEAKAATARADRRAEHRAVWAERLLGRKTRLLRKRPRCRRVTVRITVRTLHNRSFDPRSRSIRRRNLSIGRLLRLDR